MTTAIWITLIGMGMVFAVIMMLWGVMALLVWAASSHKPASEKAAVSKEEPVEAVTGDQTQIIQRRAAAAAAAVAIAVNIDLGRPKNGKTVHPDSISPWQAAHRAMEANRASIGQKPRGKR